MNRIPLLSPVALLEDLPAKGLKRGQVGTVVEELRQDVYEVEFSDDHGKAYALTAIDGVHLLPLYHEPAHRAA